jgi:hypothetical protein
MTHKLVTEYSIKFIEIDDPNFYWEFAVKNEGDDSIFELKLQVPVQGCGVVHQTFPLEKDDINQLVKWISTNMK